MTNKLQDRLRKPLYMTTPDGTGLLPGGPVRSSLLLEAADELDRLEALVKSLEAQVDESIDALHRNALTLESARVREFEKRIHELESSERRKLAARIMTEVVSRDMPLFEDAAQDAVSYADALLAALDAKP